MDSDSDTDTNERLPFDLDGIERCLANPNTGDCTIDMDAYEFFQ